MVLNTKRITVVLLSSVFIVLFSIYDIRLNDDVFDILLKNRFTGLGFGIILCGNKTATPQKQCMDDHKSSFEIWHFAHTVNGGLADNRLYPAIRE